MKLKYVFKVLALFALCGCSIAGETPPQEVRTEVPRAPAISYKDVLGQVFINSYGSSAGSLLISVSVKTESRNTVSVGFIWGDIASHTRDVGAFETSGSSVSVFQVMINCKERTYSIYANADLGDERRVSFSEFSAGRMYPWGDYSSDDLLINVSEEMESSMTKYFGTVCDYTAQ